MIQSLVYKTEAVDCIWILNLSVNGKSFHLTSHLHVPKTFIISNNENGQKKKKSGSIRLDPVRETLSKTEIINRAKS